MEPRLPVAIAGAMIHARIAADPKLPHGADWLLPPESAGDADARFAGPRERLWTAAGAGRSLAYVEAGQGPATILIHGAMMTLDDMVMGPFDTLAGSRRVVAFDRPGHGGSARPPWTDAPPWRQAQLIHAAAHALGLERPVVVGHSFGGAVALAYGMMFPKETAGVVALAPIVFPEPRLEQLLFGARSAPAAGVGLAVQGRATVDRALLPLLWNAMFLPQKMPDRMRREFPFALCGRAETTRATGEDSVGIATGLWANVWAYPTLRRPLRVLAGDADLVVNNAAHGAMLSRIAPNARFTSLRGLGHMLHHFAVDQIAAAIDEVWAEAG